MSLKFYVNDFPCYEMLGARYVVIALCDNWRDGLVTNDAEKLPTLKYELKKRFMRRFITAS